MRNLYKLFGIFVFAAIFLIGCDTALVGPNDKDTGSIVIVPSQGGDFLAKTLKPAISMDVVDWLISGAGPGGRTFGPQAYSINETAISIVELYAGSWDFTVEARNASAEVIGRGTKNVAIHSSQTTSTAITVVPLTGNGTLSLNLSWPASSLSDGNFVATLTDSSETPHVLSGTLDYGNGTASYSGQWAAGYYDLVLQLFDGENLVWGTYEAVRIVEAQTTSASIELSTTDLNPAKNGTLGLLVTNDMQNPFDVTLSGVTTNLTAGSSMQVDAQVAPAGTYAYQWFLNGTAVSNATSVTFTLGSDLGLGNYNLAVRVSDAQVISSESAAFSVVPPSNVVIDPNYNFTPDPNDVTPLQVYSVVPGNQTSSIPVTTTISIYFNDLVDPVSLDDVAMTVMVGAQRVEGNFTLERTSNNLFAVLHFKPSNALPTNSVVTVTLASENGLVDKGGNPLGTQYVYSFTTKDTALSSTDNLGFEDPDLLTGWDITGNGGVVNLPFASSLSLVGSKAVMITTGATTNYGLTGLPLGEATSILSSGNIAVSGGASNLLFDYYWISDEFIEYIGSNFDDTLTMSVSGPNGTIVQTIESINQYTVSDCIAISLAFGGEGNGSVYHTGAKTKRVDISTLGSPITVSFTISDVGDASVLSAFLVDNFRFE